MSKIPKVIHYCWFGKGNLSELNLKCIESWKRYCPDFEIIEWNENNFDINSVSYVKEAYEAKKYAFVADYVRLYALVNYGGIYMDTDVELLKPIEKLLKNDGFIGFEDNKYIGTAIIGCKKELELFNEFFSSYTNKKFLLDDKTFDMATNVDMITDCFEKYGLKKNNNKQMINRIKVFPSNYFYPKKNKDKSYKVESTTYSIHYNEGSWISPEMKKIGKNFWWKNIFRPSFAFIKHILYKLFGKQNIRGLERKVHNYIYKVK